MLLLFTAFANPAQATDFDSNFIILNGTRYYTTAKGNVSEQPFTTLTNIGIFDRGTGILTLGASRIPGKPARTKCRPFSYFIESTCRALPLRRRSLRSR
ncbi:hypothetical protein ACFQT0_25620 [Hymenobacter humi]|uniref:Uncharacterized protein n=1 Tax=Hymenobacter humi TaxID=1411620 RepID=A0ABW2UDF7_9BACT